MRLVLLGVSLPGVQNHSLRVLEAAAVRARASVRLVPFHGWPDLGPAVASVLRARPQVCGISLQTSEAALASMALAKRLRERGYQGTLVCGGHFATLNAEALLVANPALDAVVRFAGEDALCGLLRGARTQAELAQLPGLVFRGTDGRPVVGAPARTRDASDGPLLSAPDSAGELHLGFVAADLIASHGCAESCGYCCVAGASVLAAKERRRAGLPALRHARSALDAIADPIAELYHRHGARVLNVMDDNLLPREPEGAAAWANELARALRLRGVEELALSLQLRADAVSERSADALVELGLVRAYVGIDGYSAPQLRALGRRAAAPAGPRAIELLADRGVLCVANALLIGPTIGFESVLAEIEGLRGIRGAPVHLLPIEARPATRYYESARSLGLLEGGILLQHYRFLDRRTELLGRIVTSLPTRLAERSVPIALYDLGYNLGIARRLVPALPVERFVHLYRSVSEAWNDDQQRVLRAAAQIAAGGDERVVEAFLAREGARVASHDRALLQRCDDALAELERGVSRLRGRPVHAHTRGRLLGALALTMSLAGCSHASEGAAASRTTAGASGAATGGGAGAGSGSRAGSAGNAGASAGGSGGAAAGAGGGAGASAGADAGSGDAGADGGASAQCPSYMGPSLADQELFCCAADVRTALSVTFDAQGKPSAFTGASGRALSPEIESCLRSFVGDYCYPSLAGTTQQFTSHCWIA